MVVLLVAVSPTEAPHTSAKTPPTSSRNSRAGANTDVNVTEIHTHVNDSRRPEIKSQYMTNHIISDQKKMSNRTVYLVSPPQNQRDHIPRLDQTSRD